MGDRISRTVGGSSSGLITDAVVSSSLCRRPLNSGLPMKTMEIRLKQRTYKRKNFAYTAENNLNLYDVQLKFLITVQFQRIKQD